MVTDGSPLTAQCWPGPPLLPSFGPASHWPPSKAACVGEQAVLCTVSASVEFSASPAPVKASISRLGMTRGQWERRVGLLARLEARAVLGFRDKTPTPQEGKRGTDGKLALRLIKVGREEGKGRSELRCCLAPVSCCLRQESKEPAWEEGSRCTTKELCVLGQVIAPSGP